MTHAEVDLLIHAYVFGCMRARFELSYFNDDADRYNDVWYIVKEGDLVDPAYSIRKHEALYLLWDGNRRVPDYSTDMQEAIELASYVSNDQGENFNVQFISRYAVWRVGFGNYSYLLHEKEADNLPLAIALSVLHTVGIDIEQEEVK